MEKENFDNCIGKKIKNLRHKINWSQGEVAVQMNISIPAFSKIENGITDINIKRLNQIANLLGVSAHELLRGVQKERILRCKEPFYGNYRLKRSYTPERARYYQNSEKVNRPL